MVGRGLRGGIQGPLGGGLPSDRDGRSLTSGCWIQTTTGIAFEHSSVHVVEGAAGHLSALPGGAVAQHIAGVAKHAVGYPRTRAPEYRRWAVPDRRVRDAESVLGMSPLLSHRERT